MIEEEKKGYVKVSKKKIKDMKFYRVGWNCPFCWGTGDKCTCIPEDQVRSTQHDYEDCQVAECRYNML